MKGKKNLSNQERTLGEKETYMYLGILEILGILFKPVDIKEKWLKVS